MKILLFADLHICKHKRSTDRLQNCLDALEWVFLTALEKKVTNVVFAGDLFQDRSVIDIMTYHLTFKILEKYCTKLVNLWLLLGNHDMWFHDRWDINSVEPLTAIDGITFVDKPCTLEIGGHPVDFLPYTHEPLGYLNELKKSAAKTLVAHLAVDGAQLNTMHNTRADVTIEHDGEMTRVSADVFDGWDKVWLGHYHGQQKVGPVAEYIGSPLQLNFGEAFQHKHVVLYDLATGVVEYIRNQFSPQHFIIPEKDLDKYEVEKNFVRISVGDLGNADLLALKKEIQQLKPGSVEIIPAEKEEQLHLIDDAKAILQDEDKMLEVYVDQADVPGLDKKKLLEVGMFVVRKQS